MNKTWKVLLSLIGTVAAAIILVFANNISVYEPPTASTSTASADLQAAIAQHREEEANRLVSENLGPGSARTDTVPPTPRSSATTTSPLPTPETGARPFQEPYDTATAPEQGYRYEPPASHQPALAQPAPPASAGVDDAVTPGAWCRKNMAGATGLSKNGIPMTCTYEGGEDVPRWRAT